MTTFTIKGLYIGRYEERKNPTYYGTLKGAMKYADTSNFIHYGEDIKVCVGETVMAIQKWNKKVDDVGEYYEPEKWEIKR